MNEYPKFHSFSARPFRKSNSSPCDNSPENKLWAPNSRRHFVPSLPLYYFGRRFVVDLQARFFKSDVQIPTACPPQLFGLEFTGKFEPFAMLAIPYLLESID